MNKSGMRYEIGLPRRKKVGRRNRAEKTNEKSKACE